jgi:flagellar biogenesis protein FliO
MLPSSAYAQGQAFRPQHEDVHQALYAAPLPGSQAGGTPLAPRQARPEAGTPLAPRGRSSSGEASAAASGTLLTTFGSLALVLCLFFAVAWILRRGSPHALSVLPGEVVEILGRASLPGRHQMHLVRCGHKLLLVAVSTAGADTLTEITDPLEVDRLCGLCREHHPHSATATFRGILQQLGRDSSEEPRRLAGKTKTRWSAGNEDDDA